MCSSNKVRAVAFLGPSLGRNTVAALSGIPCHGSLPKFAKVVSPPPTVIYVSTGYNIGTKNLGYYPGLSLPGLLGGRLPYC